MKLVADLASHVTGKYMYALLFIPGMHGVVVDQNVMNGSLFLRLLKKYVS